MNYSVRTRYTGDWKEVIVVLQNELQWFSHVLWVRPSENNLKFLANSVIQNGLKGIVSIGCGSGLLEWLIQSATGLKVVGLEVDCNYWKSYHQHNGPSFIQHIFPDSPEFRYYCTSEKYALLFCYFNYRKPFDDYMCNYKGNCVIIIGPGYGRGTHTNPEPLDPKFSHGNWILNGAQEIGNTKDFIAVYINREKNKEVNN
ncbi:uncharacterized protein LOC142327289 isoform X2 [Lycorma delicatula]|uniref:uncharacterized protein LOC142327289 isoform X2 n=1 Tax=Lycorma delicatula TaxID=130591 RepID=UPI003F516B28